MIDLENDWNELLKDEFEKEKEVKTYPIILIAPKHKSDEKNIIKE